MTILMSYTILVSVGLDLIVYVDYYASLMINKANNELQHGCGSFAVNRFMFLAFYLG